MRTTQPVRLVCLIWCFALIAGVDAAVAQSSATKRVLLLQSRLGEQGNARFAAAFVGTLRSADSAEIDIDVVTETIEPLRSPYSEGLFTEYLRHKYAERTIDAIVAVGVEPLRFARRNRSIFGNPPIVTAVSQAGEIDPNDDITGLRGGPVSGIEGILDLALSLRPETCRVFIIDGARGNTGELEASVKRRWAEYGRRGISLAYLRDLPLSQVVARLAAVRDQSVVLFVRQTLWNETRDVSQLEALEQVLRASPVPVFSTNEDFVGRGVVGGHMWSFEVNGSRMAEMTKQILNGASVRDVPVSQATYNDVFDWRQLQRWQIAESRVPAGGVVLFRQQPIFEQYRGYVLSGIIVFAAQLGLIVGLLVQRSRRRRAEEKARKSDERYRSVVDTQSDLICRFLPDTTLTFVNDAYCRFWNKTREELLGHKFLKLIPPSAHAQVLERFAHVSAGSNEHEHAVTLHDGTVGWQHWINHAILDSQGRVIEFQGVGRDITERIRAEEARSRLEARNIAMLRAIPDLMFVMRRDGTFVDYHVRDSNSLFAAPTAFLGRTVREILPPEQAEMLMDAVERASASEDPVVVEYELPMDGPRSFEARLVCVEPDRVLSIVRDVTDAKRTIQRNRHLAGRLIESQEIERTRIARDLHDGVCQEIAAVGLDVSTLQHAKGDLQGQQVQEQLMDLQRRTSAVAEDLRRLSHGLHSSVLHHVGLTAALQAHCADVERQHGLQVTFNADHGVEPTSQSVALSLFRITQEALRNAVQHGHAQHATVSLSRDNGYLELSVIDDGKGFDVTASRANSGLGLVSMEERARLIDGKVDIHSAPGSGTVIDVRIPLKSVDRVDATRSEFDGYLRPRPDRRGSRTVST